MEGAFFEDLDECTCVFPWMLCSGFLELVSGLFYFVWVTVLVSLSPSFRFFFSLFTEIGPLAKVPEYIRVQLIVLCSYACLSRVILHPPVLYERYSYSVLWYSAHFMKKIVN